MSTRIPVPNCPDFCSLRYGLALIMHFSNFTMITQRVSLSIAIIAMVNSTQRASPSNASFEDPLADTLSNPSKPIKELNTRASVYQWSPETQGIIFSSINYGIILTLIPSGYLAGIFGAKQMLGAGLLISSLLTLFTPLAADFGVILVIIIRTFQGMAQGMAWTGQFTIWAKWAPPLERSKLTSIAGSGKCAHRGPGYVTWPILHARPSMNQASCWEQEKERERGKRINEKSNSSITNEKDSSVL